MIPLSVNSPDVGVDMHRDNNFTARETDIQAVDATVLPGDPYHICDFCGKLVAPGDSTAVLEKLSGPGRFFCDFCLRQRHNTKQGRNVLALSFRGMVAYLYYEIYLSSRSCTFSEIEDLISDHAAVGLENPVFSYDPETMLWYIDFSRVGFTKKKIHVNVVKSTVNEILNKLSLPYFVGTIQLPKLEAKFNDAIDEFYHKRSRPFGRRLLIPTLKGCGSLEPKNHNWDKHKDFVSSHFVIRNG
jgi:hypothetical protein